MPGACASSQPGVPGAERFRILCPTSCEYRVGIRATLELCVARLNGLLGGQLAPESARPAQAYFIGGIIGKPQPRVAVVRGTRIDLRTDLDARAIYLSGEAAPTRGKSKPRVARDILVEVPKA
jgi:hypothetical protein